MVAIKMGMKQQEEYDGDGAAAVSSTQKMVFAYYVTGHGFGHATRVAEVVRHLILAGHDVHVVTAAPEFVFTNEVHSPRLFFRKVVLECGAVQSDALTVDSLATLERYTEETVKPRASILAKETEWLKFINADLVVSDVVSTVCRVAADVGIPSVCVANFSWDIIYLDYVMAAGPDSRSIVLQIAEDYSNCNFLIRLPGYCPMPAFRNVIDVPLVVRKLYKSTEEVREELGIADNVKLVILNFGGQPSELKLKEFLPSGWLCLVCGASDTQDLPANFKKLSKNVYTPDIIAASDCMIGKLGYGSHYQGGIEMSRNDLLSVIGNLILNGQ
ncbi:L-arabinokinase [Arachis hypogaea]|nr:L-arabinokinase [Arachis hypogaea]